MFGWTLPIRWPWLPNPAPPPPGPGGAYPPTPSPGYGFPISGTPPPAAPAPPGGQLSIDVGGVPWLAIAILAGAGYVAYDQLFGGNR